MSGNVHDITSFDRDEFDEGDQITEAAEVLNDLFVKPFWKSTIVRLGCVLVALKAVDVAGKIILARNAAKRGF